MKSFKISYSDIKKFKYWTLTLHRNQSYLGRAICYLNRDEKDVAKITEAELLELLKIIKIYQRKLTNLWHPDLWNYAKQGNAVPQLHFHFVPRYKTERIFENKKFIDRRWGKNYAPSPKRKENKKLNQKIKLAIQLFF